MASVPSAPEFTDESSAAAFSAVLGSFSKMDPQGAENPSTRSLAELSSSPVPTAFGAEAAVKSAASFTQAGKPTGFAASISGLRLPSSKPLSAAQQVPASGAATSPTPAKPFRPDAPAAVLMNASPSLLLQLSSARRPAQGLPEDRPAQVSLATCDTPASSVIAPEAPGRAAEPPAEILGHALHLQKTAPSLDTPSGTSQAAGALPTPSSLVFAARLTEQPPTEATPGAIRVNPAVEPPASGAAPDATRMPSLELPSGTNPANRPLPTPHLVPADTRPVERPVPEAAAPGDNRPAAPASQTASSAVSQTPAAVAVQTPGLAASAAPTAPKGSTPPSSKDFTQTPSPPQTANAGRPEMAAAPPTEVHAPAVEREDAGNAPLAAKVVRRDNPATLETAGGPPGGGGSQPHTPGLEMAQPPSRPAQSGPSGEAQPGRVDEPALTQILGGAEPREAAATATQHNIAVRFTADQSPPVEVRVMDRGGEVRVAVHSPDPATSESVRAGLPDLVARLGQRGYETEIWHPPAGPPSSSTNQQRESGGAFGSGAHQQTGGGQQRQSQRQPQPAWVEEMENNLNQTTDRSPITWPPQSTR